MFKYHVVMDKDLSQRHILHIFSHGNQPINQLHRSGTDWFKYFDDFALELTFLFQSLLVDGFAWSKPEQVLDFFLVSYLLRFWSYVVFLQHCGHSILEVLMLLSGDLYHFIVDFLQLVARDEIVGKTCYKNLFSFQSVSCHA